MYQSGGVAQAAAELHRQFRAGSIEDTNTVHAEKTYLAIVRGYVSEAGTIDDPLKNKRHSFKEGHHSKDELQRNEPGTAQVFFKDENASSNVSALNGSQLFGKIDGCSVVGMDYEETSWKDEHLKENAVLKPELLPGVIVPHPGFPTLRVPAWTILWLWHCGGTRRRPWR